MIGRFAPSPTGAMHLGNARTALLAWLHTRAHGGQHILRIEDLDVGRVRPYAYELIRQDLLWLGLDWDAEYLQSERLELYQAAVDQLQTYSCSCTRRQILEAASAPHGPEIVYACTCRHSSSTTKPAALRWIVPDQTLCLTDGRTLQTLCQHLPTAVGDFVVQRAGGVFAYHLAVVVDDAAMHVTDIVRGEDLLSSTPRQIALQQALSYPTPRYFHVPLMTDYRGERLAKRGGAPSLRDLRESGVSPEKILSNLARSLGWEVPDEVTAAELIPIYSNLCTIRQPV